MSSIWNVSVLDKGKEWIDLKLVFAHPDAGPFPEEKPFALSLLTHEAYSFDKKYQRVPNSFLANEMDFDKSYDLEYLGTVADKYIKDVKIYEAVNLPWDEDLVHEKINSLCETEGLSEDDDAWEETWEKHWIDFWDNPNNLPQAKYRIKVTDEKWITHLSLGQEFDSASYGIEGSYISDNIKLELPPEADATARPFSEDFKDAHIPPHKSIIDNDDIRSLCIRRDFMPEDELKNALEKHKLFLDNGGRNGVWTRLEAAGLPLNLYSAKVAEGEQLKLMLKKINPETLLFEEKDIEAANLSGAYFEKVSFKGAKLNNSLITDSILTYANFENAELIGTDFTNADLRHANFKGANLSKADFEIANCKGADFTGAILDGASFKGATLKDVIRE